MRALIVGGGIGGLASAIGLCRAGWEVTVAERAPTLAGAGTGLGIWPEALRALDRLGLGERMRAEGSRQAAGVIRRASGRYIATIDAAKIEKRAGDPVHLVSRPALLAMLHDAVPDGVVRFASPVTDPAALFSEYDVVIGADGSNSGVRRALFGDRYALRYYGLTAWRGVVEVDSELGGEAWAPGRKFGYTPQEPGRTNWYATLCVPEGYVPPEGDVPLLVQRFGDWPAPIPEILTRIKPDEILRHPLHHLDPPLPSYVRGNVALLGDAAHAMAPDLGQGACQAMIDGLVLGECLIGAPDVRSGLREYDRRRRRRTQRIAAMALRASRLSGAKRFVWLRDAVTRTLLAVTSPGG